MLIKTEYKVSDQLLKQAQNQLPSIDYKLTINEPTGNFFYDPWVIKDQYRNTVWEQVLNSLPVIQGEARLILLEPGRAYQSHSDIDNRYHLNIDSDNRSFLVNLDSECMYPILQDCCWYYLDAGPRHSAVNFGKRNRVQLVVRELLTPAKLIDSVKVTISGTDRFLFDDVISNELHNLNKENLINSFTHNHISVSFNIEKSSLHRIVDICPSQFNLTYE